MRPLTDLVAQHRPHVSIHASVKDATGIVMLVGIAVNSFNPRIRKGCDAVKTAGELTYRRFNPRIRKGCDTYDESTKTLTYVFQSTHP